MCYAVFLSTTSAEDLSKHDFDAVSFVGEASTQEMDRPYLARLHYPSKYFVSTYGGCSCHFRHAEERDELFEPPVDWEPEDPEDVEATGKLYELLVQMVSSGHRVDLIDVWNDDEVTEEVGVSLSAVPKEAFRLVNGVHMNFST
jgi:hypothetical protein